MRSSKPTVKGRKRDTSDRVVAATAVTAVVVIVLAKLAFLALLGWGFYELVNWVTAQ